MTSSTVKKSPNLTFVVFIPMIIGLHVGWYWLQQTCVPPHQRHEHPLMKYLKKYTT